jgi:hypothetical protein
MFTPSLALWSAARGAGGNNALSMRDAGGDIVPPSIAPSESAGGGPKTPETVLGFERPLFGHRERTSWAVRSIEGGGAVIINSASIPALGMASVCPDYKAFSAAGRPEAAQHRDGVDR